MLTTVKLGETEVAGCEARFGGPALPCTELVNYLLDAMIALDRNEAVRDKAHVYHHIISEQAPERKAALASQANQLAIVYGNLRQLDNARRFAEQEIALETERLGNSRDLVIALSNWATALDHKFGRHREGEVVYRQALKVAEAIAPRDEYSLGLVLSNLARCLDNQGRMMESLATYRQALASRLAYHPPGHPAIAVTQFNLALVLIQFGQYEEAESLMRAAYAAQLAKLGEASPAVHNSMLALGNHFVRTGRFGEARAMFDKVLPLATGDRRLTVRIRLALLESRIGNLAAARQLLAEAIDLATGDAPGLVQFQARARLGLAQTLLADPALAEGPERAMAEARKVLRTLETSVDDREPFIAEAHSLIAQAALRSDDRATATEAYRAAERVYVAGFGEKHPALLVVRARLAGLMPDAAARPRLSQLAGLARTMLADFSDQARLDVLQDLDIAAVFSEQLAVLRRLAAGHQRGTVEWQGLADEAFVAAQSIDLAGSARVLQRALLMHNAGDEALARLVREQTTLAQQLASMDRDFTYTSTEAERGVLVAEMQRLRSEYDAVTRRLRTDYPDFVTATTAPAPLTLAEAQQSQAANSALTLIADNGQGGYELFVVRPRDVNWVNLDPATAARLNALSVEMRDALVNALLHDAQAGERGRLVGRPQRRRVDAIADAVGQTLLARVAADLRGVRHMDIVTSSPVATLPLSALRLGKRWLGERMTMTRFPASLQAASRSPALPKGGPLRVVGIGDGRSAAEQTALDEVERPVWATLPALPFARAQIADMARLPGVLLTSLDGEAAGETVVKASREIAEADVLVFATHSFVDERGRLGLVLGKGEAVGSNRRDDGFLTIEEIAQLPLKGGLVILSACDTAQQAPGDPDPVGSFARAFFAAGARSVVVSHWPIEDRAAQLLMSTFVRRLAAEPSLSSADHLAAAVAQMRRSGDSRFRSPANWAAFSVIGR